MPDDPRSPEDRGPEAPPEARRRRPRYSGTHPSRFEDRYKERNPDRYPDVAAHVLAQGRTPAGTHVPILVDAVLACLAPGPGEVVADCTLGYGGHAEAFATRIGPEGVLVGLDLDGPQLERTRARLDGRGIAVRAWNRSFAGLAQVLAAEELDGADVIFADLGVSSMQVDDPARGFSYKVDGPLDMRLDPRKPRTAADLLARLGEAELAGALAELSDEPAAEAIARAIVRERERAPLARTGRLVEVVLGAQGLTVEGWKRQARAGDAGTHPAARTFQALRILVNDELVALDRFLSSVPDCLRPGGRVGVLTFHSGEDRRVKQSFRDGLRGGVYDAVAPDPVRPDPEEVRANPRAAPAKLRWARRAR